MEPQACLAAAIRIGDRLARQALWQGSRCSWEVKVLAGGPGRRTETKAAGPELYQGTAGIAWFLAELSRRTGSESLRRTAAAGLDHALAGARELPPASFGFHGGRVGVAWAAARLAPLLERPELEAAAWEMLAPLAGREAEDHGLDVIAGAAGAIPALLELAYLLGREEPRETARRLGDHLLLAARRDPGGWSWPTLRGAAVRNLAGLAHGSAGAAVALLDLARATGDGRYRFGAEMAFLYERRLFDEERSNWPDLRNQALGELIRAGRWEEIRRAARRGTLPPYERHFMTAWCHGSPGGGLARLRACELDGRECYRRELRSALASTLPSLEGAELRTANFSLCHGVAGNCELPLAAAELLAEPRLREACLAAADFGWQTYEAAGRPWPCGTLTAEPDPSLMIGEAGIGSFFLRLADPELASPLLLRPRHPPRETAGEDEKAGFQALAQETVDEAFGPTLKLWCRLDPLLDPLCAGACGEVPPEPAASSPVEEARRELEGRVAAAQGRQRELLADAFLLDHARFELAAEPADLSEEFVRGIVRPPWEELDPRQVRLLLAPGHRPLATRWKWPEWSSEAAEPPEAQAFFLIFRARGRTVSRRVGAFAYLLLEALAEPASLADLVEAVAAALDGAPAGPEALETQVLSQLAELYRAGHLDAVAAAGSAPLRRQPARAEA